MNPVIVVASAAVLLIAMEQSRPAAQPRVNGWLARLALLNIAQIAVVYLGAITWAAGCRGFVGDGEAFGALPVLRWAIWRSRSSSSGGIARATSSIPVAVVPSSPSQPARVEVVTSFYKHPFELLANSFLSSLILHVFVGLAPASASVAWR